MCNIDSSVCEHKGVFPQLPLEIGGAITLILVKVCLTVAGIGGGGVVVAMGMGFWGF
jgi:hypothetical protein